MDGGLATSIASVSALLITAIVKFVPARSVRQPITCLKHAGLEARLDAGDKDFKEIKETLQRIDDNNMQLRGIIAEIHARVVK